MPLPYALHLGCYPQRQIDTNPDPDPKPSFILNPNLTVA